MHSITHCFFSQAVYIRLTLDIKFVHLAPTQCMLNKAHVCTHYAKQKSGIRPPLHRAPHGPELSEAVRAAGQGGAHRKARERARECGAREHRGIAVNIGVC